MTANSLANPVGENTDASLASFLRERRSRLQPAKSTGRRRTPGLRREEVAARAGVSVTWYTWLEQGRGGPPSEDVLERLARALELDAVGREFLFLLAQQRPPPRLGLRDTPAVEPSLQRVLDAMSTSPALVKTATWEVVAWNRAAAAVLTDYGKLPLGQRNVLRGLFCNPAVRGKNLEWEKVARFAIEVFRIDVARVGNPPEAGALVDELLAASDDFRRIWADSDVRNHGAGVKRLHTLAGPVALEYSAFHVDGADGLSLVIYTPATPADQRAVEALIAQSIK
ncbi:MAG: helix-turn-helix transcriptional regulator [Polyangiales bacterium]